MKKCLYCNRPVKNKYCNTSCQNRNTDNKSRNDKLYGKLINFEVNCHCCDKTIVVTEREKYFPKKEKYFCDRKCANTRTHNSEIKNKISQSLIYYNKVKEKPKKIVENKSVKKSHKHLICHICHNHFTNENFRKTCSTSCYRLLLRSICGKRDLKKIEYKKNNSDLPVHIYCLTDESGLIRYVGKSENVLLRYKSHLKQSKYKRTYKEKWINSMLENGFKPGYFILDTCIYGEWSFWESYWINQLMSWGFKLTNGTSGGEGSDGFRGRKHTEITKQKISDKLRVYYKKN